MIINIYCFYILHHLFCTCLLRRQGQFLILIHVFSICLLFNVSVVWLSCPSRKKKWQVTFSGSYYHEVPKKQMLFLYSFLFIFHYIHSSSLTSIHHCTLVLVLLRRSFFFPPSIGLCNVRMWSCITIYHLFSCFVHCSFVHISSVISPHPPYLSLVMQWDEEVNEVNKLWG